MCGPPPPPPPPPYLPVPQTGALAAGRRDETMVWAWVPAGQLHGLQARALSFGGPTGSCDLCGTLLAGGATACPSCMACLRLLRAM
eukprot:2272607-Alexandrium_andersonii.AAC.1